MLPFTKGEFLEVFATYNIAVWPAQPFAYVLALIIVAALVRRDEIHQRLALALTGLLWIWTGVAYHWLFFSEINPAAIGFGLLFVAEGGVLTGLAVQRASPLHFRLRADLSGIAGASLIVYATILYPLIDLYLGRWPRTASFGITPCPLTLFTLGFLLLAQPRPPFWVWLAPLAWTVIGGTAAFLLEIPQDWALLASGPAAFLLIRASRSRSIVGGIDCERDAHETSARCT